VSYSIIPIDKFKKEAKRLIRKYPSLKIELSKLSLVLTANPTAGAALGNDTYKIRVAIKSKGTGKSVGTRLITMSLPKIKKFIY